MSDKPEAQSRRFRLGPGIMVTAAFIGPGTVITASKAGTQFGNGLLWAVALAVVGAIVLQGLVARLGILTKSGLSEAIRETLHEPATRRLLIGLVIAAIGLGNAAYQTGNLMGAASGMVSIFGGTISIWVLVLAAVTLVIILVGSDKLVQRLLIGLVVLLSLTFVLAAISVVATIPLADLPSFRPVLSSQNLAIAIGLIGTTIVPYNLFLHASRAAENWSGVTAETAIQESRWDTGLSIALGGMVTAAILFTASSVFFQADRNWENIAQVSLQLRPVLGDYSGVGFAIGLFCAGLTSSLTAPIATSYAVCGCLGWSTKPSSSAFRVVASIVVIVGTVSAVFLGSSPGATIIAAQITNGLLLPIVASLAAWIVWRKTTGTQHAISFAGWMLVCLVIVLVSALGIWRISAEVGLV